MTMQEALNMFGLSGDLTEKDIKVRYKKLALKFHPDRNPVGADLMKALNAAFEFLMKNIDYINVFQDSGNAYNYGEDLEAALKALLVLNDIIYEIIGNWIWISGNTKANKAELSKIGCRWAPRKKMWYFRPEEHKSRKNRDEMSIEEIRDKYGSSGKNRTAGRVALQ